MKTFPLKAVNLEEAKEKQFELVEIITKHMTGKESLNLGDLGVSVGLNKPVKTKVIEKILAEYFDAEDCILVRGAGTAAIKWGLFTSLKPLSKVLIHKAPIYPTTETSLNLMGLKLEEADFNNGAEVEEALKNRDIEMVLIQHTRQKMDDSYDLGELISLIKNKRPDLPILVDDNYAVMKSPKIGCELGADLSAFSLFKLLGPEGIGCLVGKKELIKKVSEKNYSGGSQVQGYEAVEALRGLVYAPVSLAIQAEETDKLVDILNNKEEFPYIKEAFLANAQSKVLLIEFFEEVAVKILEEAERLGALPNPVGAESKYEIVPLFYRVSGTFLKANPSLAKKMIRINPNRAGHKTVIKILKNAYKNL